MTAANTPAAEAERLESLRRGQILDTPPETFFDEITRLASEICQTPIALVHWSTAFASGSRAG